MARRRRRRRENLGEGTLRETKESPARADAAEDERKTQSLCWRIRV